MAKGLTKKALKQPDQLQSLSGRIYEHILKHRQTVYLCSGIAAAVVLIVLGWYFYQLRYESKAADLYGEAYGSYSHLLDSPELPMDNLAEAVKRYNILVEKYPSSQAALTARYSLGNLYYSMQDYDRSIESYLAFIRKAPRGSMLTPLTWYSLGYCYEAKGDFEKALESFEKALAGSTGLHFRVINYSNMARILDNSGNTAKAVEYYEKVIEADSDPLLSSLAKSRIATIQ